MQQKFLYIQLATAVSDTVKTKTPTNSSKSGKKRSTKRESITSSVDPQKKDDSVQGGKKEREREKWITENTRDESSLNDV